MPWAGDTGWGSRWGQDRRDRLAYLAVLRRSSTYTLRAKVLRAVARRGGRGGWRSAAVGGARLLLWLPAALCVVLQLVQAHRSGCGVAPPAGWPGLPADMIDTDGKHRLASAPTPRSAAASAGRVAAWVTTDVLPVARLVVLAAAVGHFASTPLRSSPTTPGSTPMSAAGRPGTRSLRWVSGPLTAGAGQRGGPARRTGARTAGWPPSSACCPCWSRSGSTTPT